MLMLLKEKRAFRAGLRRHSLSPDATQAMQEALFSLHEWLCARSIFCYVSVENEPDTRAILRQAFMLGKSVSVPKVYGQGKILAHIIQDEGSLQPGALAIPEPPESAPVLEKPDIVIVPCLACDKQGNRLGHGGGYYDRYLSAVKSFSVCLCSDELLFDEIPHVKSDYKPDIILTPTRILRRKD